MKKSRYTDEQIAYALRQAETGTPVAEVIRRMSQTAERSVACRQPCRGKMAHDHPECAAGVGRLGTASDGGLW